MSMLSNRLVFGAAMVSLVLWLPGNALAERLGDGTPVRVRLLKPINSESAKSGQPLEFVVTRDVVVDGRVLIKRGTLVSGAVVRARRADWDFTDHDHPKLAFRFHHTTASNGGTIHLRASSVRQKDDQVVLERYRGHELLWAGEADTFEAFVDGDYYWEACCPATDRP
jgi:hypothetical protein